MTGWFKIAVWQCSEWDSYQRLMDNLRWARRHELLAQRVYLI